ncbi:membrane protein US21 [Panine betaherpesvirus 2]|uniref:Membrane protein US21 n=1 Tax=Panine betaherpesvirus 2 TaxID=188763 RepID=Q8QRT8_9BETA|nr:membrane protein US21 [Panine betaherpesvirus 2]AAM00800.1 membrane protein US21 [Panine betaherpesvirus 2]QXV67918.1 membrane protein US21 [Panine betaherpesvirus 2]
MSLRGQVQVARSVFLLRIYILMWVQSLILMSVCGFCWLVFPHKLEHLFPSVRLTLSCLMISIVCLGLLRWAEPNFPKNVWLLLTYTLLTSVAVTASGFHFSHRSVIYAMIATVVLFCFLTLATYTFARDVELQRSLLTAASALILLLFLVFSLFPEEVGEIVVMVAGLAVIVTSVVCDTQDILHDIEYESYIQGALYLYMDLMYLFVSVLYFMPVNRPTTGATQNFVS